ncbi:MAG TPA: nucleotidyl transferase AbiEii/AbiGii toxin family protein [Candidatus Pacearchaeota archaeon]|nr:nucleotidyl transferase AbiEii/AbiGii toxin family protein [Candidatus Pacearchaeota archaeon]
MYPEALTPDTQSVLKIIGESGLSQDFYLAGGTALALYFGHRFSVDRDWFTERFNETLSSRYKVKRKIKSEMQNFLGASRTAF